MLDPEPSGQEQLPPRGDPGPSRGRGGRVRCAPAGLSWVTQTFWRGGQPHYSPTLAAESRQIHWGSRTALGDPQSLVPQRLDVLECL